MFQLYPRGNRAEDLVRVLVTAIAIMVVAANPARATLVGTLPGSFSVTPDGQAGYSIPIAVPPGVSGAVPTLSISYSSSSGNGLLGVGWGLGGIGSSIRRCSKVVEPHGVAAPMKLDNTDAFCLDSSLLILINGQNGKTDAEYRTEIDGYSRIRVISEVDPASGVLGPKEFVVETKAGLKLFFGHTALSRIYHEGASSPIATWFLDRIQDSYGNYTQIHHMQDTVAGEYLPTAITYTANDSSGAALSASRAVVFVYSAKMDGTGKTAWTHGVRYSTLRRIDEIRTYINAESSIASGISSASINAINPPITGTLVSRYQMRFDTSVVTKRQLLKGVTKCGATDCLPETTFTYRDMPGGLLPSDVLTKPADAQPAIGDAGQDWNNALDNGSPYMGDFNGDGRSDVFWFRSTPGGANAILDFSPQGQPAGKAVDYGAVFPNVDDTTPLIADYNGDGVADIFFYRSNRQKLFISDPNGAHGAGPFRFNLSHCGTTAPSDAPCPIRMDLAEEMDQFPGRLLVADPVAADFNGDGLSDIFYRQRTRTNVDYDTERIRLFLRVDPRATDPASTASQSFDHGPSGMGTVIDTLVTPPPTGPYTYDDYGNVLQQPVKTRSYQGDFNGDGLVDVIVFDIAEYGGPLPTSDPVIAPGIVPGYPQYYCYSQLLLNQGDGTFKAMGGTLPPTYYIYHALEQKHVYPADFNGDGLTDLFFRGNRYPETHTVIAYARGDGTFEEVIDPLQGHVLYDLAVNYLGDFNSDGFLDLLSHLPGDQRGQNQMFLSDGKGNLVFTPPVGRSVSEHDYLGDLDGGFYFVVGDFDGNNAADVFAVRQGPPNTGSGVNFIYYNQFPSIDILTGITDGVGARIDIDYSNMSDSSIYTKGPDAGFGVINMPTSQAMVRSHRASNGNSVNNGQGVTLKSNEFRYKYESAKLSTRGRGFLGITKFTVDDPGLKTRVESVYSTKFPTAGTPISGATSVIAADGSATILEQSTTTMEVSSIPVQGGRVYRTNVKTVRTDKFGLDGQALARIDAVNSDFDDFGNVGTVRTTTSDFTDPTGTKTYTKNVTAYYDNIVSASAWIPARMWCSMLTDSTTGLGLPSETRSTSFEYDAVTGILLKETAEPAQFTRNGQICGTRQNSADISISTLHRYSRYGESIGTGPGGTLAGTVIQYSEGGVPKQRVVTADYVGGTGPNTPTQTVQTTDAEGYQSTATIDMRWGVGISATSVDGKTTQNALDILGRVTSTTFPTLKRRTVNTYFAANAPSQSCIPSMNATYVTVVADEGGNETATCMDILQRPISVRTYDAFGNALYQVTVYDDYGRVQATSRPHAYSGDLTGFIWDAFTLPQDRDAAGRPTKVTKADGTITTYQYSGYTITSGVSNPNYASLAHLPQQRTVRANALALTTEVNEYVDGNTIVTKLSYDANGSLLSVTDNNNNVLRFAYDAMGRQSDVYDPDLGHWQYTYYPTGELKTQTDAKLQTTRFYYDNLGRAVRRIDPPALGSTSGEETRWEYHPANAALNDRGKLKRVANSAYERTVTYETVLGLPDTVQSAFDGQRFATRTQYDAFGRASILTYPETQRQVRYGYGTRGHLMTVQDVASGITLWTAKATDQEGRLNAVDLGNGLTTRRTWDPITGALTSIKTGIGAAAGVQNLSYSVDPVGNLLSRTDGNQPGGTALTESFTYDKLNRLRTSSVGGKTTDYRYDTLGNLTYRSDTGYLVYDRRHSEGPHAVSQVRYTDPSVSAASAGAGDVDSDGLVTAADYQLLVKKIINGGLRTDGADCVADGVINAQDLVCITNKIVNSTQSAANAVAGEYFYDANGSLTEGGGRAITYTPFNMPKTIRASSLSASPADVTFDYDTERSRIKQVAQANGQTTTTYYAGNAYEKIIRPDGVIEKKHYITAGGTIAVLTVRSDNPTVTETRYLHGDHLGSTDVITTETGTVDQRMSFAAFGGRRNSSGWDGAATGNPSATTTRGYTGHEALDSLGLVHMNARLYDPVLGRFMAADTVSPSFTASQALNRYSYVDNNPLAFTDPTGHSSIRELIRDKRTVQFLLTVGAGIACGPYCAAAVSYATVKHNGGTDRQAMLSAAVAYAGTELGSATTSNTVRIAAAVSIAAIGVYQANASGGSKWHAIAAVAFSYAGTSAIGAAGLTGVDQYIAQTLVSGTASVIGDGKFANGAVAVLQGWLTAAGRAAVDEALAETSNVDAYKMANNTTPTTTEQLANPTMCDACIELPNGKQVSAQQVEDTMNAIMVAGAIMEPETGVVGGFFKSLLKKIFGKGGTESAAKAVGRSVDDILKPGGDYIGTVEKGATPNIRTVSPKDFAELQNELLTGSKQSSSYAGGKGTWYELPSGGRVGVRTSGNSGGTLDVDIPGYPKGFKVHQK